MPALPGQRRIRARRIKILLTGANGQLGRALPQALLGHEVVALSHAQLDITKFNFVREALDLHRPDRVINTAAYTNLDGAEEDQESAYRANAPGPGLFIAEEIAHNRFKIAGGRAEMKVSWQATGTRQDAYANAHRTPVEEEKSASERGFFIHPELHGQPAEKSVERARNPELMDRLNEQREKLPRAK